MTKKEAIDLLDNLIGFIEDNHGSDYDEALKIAIKALEQELCEDAISRQAVMDELNRLGRNAFKDDTDYDNFFTFVDNLPSVNPTSNVSIQITEREKYGRFN